MKSSWLWKYSKPFFFLFSPQSNVKHKSQETKRLGHKMPSILNQRRQREENRQDDLERFYLLDSSQDAHFTKNGSESLWVPSCCHLISSRHPVCKQTLPLWRNCQRTLIHVLCLRMLEILSRAFNSLLRVNWVLWQEHNHQARLLLGLLISWAHDSLTQPAGDHRPQGALQAQS